MKYKIILSKIPVLSWVGIRNPYRATVISSEGSILGHLRKEGRRSTLRLESIPQGVESHLVAIEDGYAYSIKDDCETELVKSVHRYNSIEISAPSLGKMNNFGFGAWSCPWGVIRISTFRTSIEVEVLEKRRTAEFLLLGYLSYFTMSRIGH